MNTNDFAAFPVVALPHPLLNLVLSPRKVMQEMGPTDFAGLMGGLPKRRLLT